jgi:hypothetical protein
VPARLQHGGKQRAGDRDLADEVDLHLPPPVLDGHELDGPADRGARVVDEHVQLGADALCRGGDVVV